MFQGNERGFGFIIPDDGEEDIYIPSGSSGGAVHGDKVIARIVRMGRRNREGEVVKIVLRGNSTFVGHYTNGYLIPDDRRIPFAIKINKASAKRLDDGCKAVARVDKWGKNTAEGTVIKVLGGEGIESELNSIFYKYGFDPEFPPKVMREAESLPEETDFSGRADFRDKLIFTIDGFDAKDFDDAISLEKIPGGYRLGVHIADVSHYVRKNSAIDIEAYSRGTSCYLPGRVAHMLPQRLSNGLCSLRPNEDRLTVSVIMDISEGGQVMEHEAVLSVIRSKERMTYDDVALLLSPDPPKELLDRYSHLMDTLREMKKLSEILCEKRRHRGAIDFDLPEPAFVLNERGEPVDVKVVRTNAAHRIIEEFMLLCNETVARRIANIDLPFVYRVHEDADEGKIERFSLILHNLGYRLNVKPTPKDLQKILDKTRGTPHEKMVITLMLRSMMKARYSPDNLGHFGLATPYYCHFTSPIRRYPDLVCHRILKKQIKGGLSAKSVSELKAFTAEAAIVSSKREEAAAQAENESIGYMLCEYMKNKVGMEFSGIISSVTSFGLFVELENTAEGLVRLENIGDGNFEYDEGAMEIKNFGSGHSYKIGDRVTVKVEGVNPALRQIDFSLSGGDEIEGD